VLSKRISIVQEGDESLMSAFSLVNLDEKTLQEEQIQLLYRS
jgi:hypothetical protein